MCGARQPGLRTFPSSQGSPSTPSSRLPGLEKLLRPYLARTPCACLLGLVLPREEQAFWLGEGVGSTPTTTRPQLSPQSKVQGKGGVGVREPGPC